MPLHTAACRSASAAQVEYIRPYGSTDVPADLSRRCSSAASTASAASTSARSARAIRDTGLVLGGNKSLLFNAEYLINIAGPVRLVLFYDAGQVRDIGESFALEGRHHRAVDPGAAADLSIRSRSRSLTDPNAPPPFERRDRRRPARSRRRPAPRSASSCRC